MCDGVYVYRSLADIMSEYGIEIRKALFEAKKAHEDFTSRFSEEIIQKKKILAQTIFDMTIKMFLRDNLVHGDLHSGNVM